MKIEKNLLTIQNFMPNKFKIISLGGNIYELLLHENIKEIIIDNLTQYQSDLTLAKGVFQNNNELKAGLISLKYSIVNEIALQYKEKDSHEFVEYRNFVEECKKYVDDNF